MQITIITLFPKMIASFFEESIVKRAIDKKVVTLKFVQLRDFAVDSYKSIDDRPYGGGAGMVLRVEPIHKALKETVNSKRKKGRKIILTSPRGAVYSQKKAQELAKLDHLVLIAGHYEGVDERVEKYIDEEISLGDFVMTGGEIAAAAIVDSVVRLLSGVLKKEVATQIESFFEVDIERVIESVPKSTILDSIVRAGAKTLTLLEYPHYTRPEEFDGQKVPEILLSGNHAEIEKWRIKRAFEETVRRRFDLLVKGKNL